MLTNKQVARILSETNVFAETDIEKYSSLANSQNKNLESYLIAERLISEDSLYENAAGAYHLPFVRIKDQPIRKDVLYLIPEPLAQHYQILALDVTPENVIKVVTTDPENLQAFEFLRKKTGKEVEVSITTPTVWRDLAKQYHKSLQAEFQDLTKAAEGLEVGDDKLAQLAEDLPVVRVVDTILEYAIFESASDIHIEPEDVEINVRFRVDGVLRHIMTLPKTIHPGVVARIKVLSNLKLDEHRLPQDGRFKIESRDYKISFRVSIIPTFDGEKLVLRLLNEGGTMRTLAQIGLQAQAFAALQRSIKKPHGMILVTGPTGSGKTTTLYTILNALNKPEVNISTVEDPIEYRMQHVNQSQVNPKIGYTFALGLRALLRQDPNIIMVGEIRDTETAEIAVNAAMTGHLLLSTLHTNNAATAIPRLIDMGIPPFLVSSTVLIVAAQRLVRTICPHCITSYNLDKKMLQDLSDQFDLQAILSKLIETGSVVKSTKNFDTILFYRGKGCRQCNDEGYKGRVGIYEIMEMVPEISEAVMRKATPEELTKMARERGMLTIVEDGFLKARAGVTSIEEVLRVTQE
jgi:type IV pilus assembly protein PilB